MGRTDKVDVHLFPNTEEGHALLHQLQQRAEAWAEGVSHEFWVKLMAQGILTMIFSTDNFCSHFHLSLTRLTVEGCLDMMKKNASRMRVISVYDLSAKESLRALRHLRGQHLKDRYPGQEVKVESDEILRRVYETIGGRTSYLSRVARGGDMLGRSVFRTRLMAEEAENMVEGEKQWLLSR